MSAPQAQQPEQQRIVALLATESELPVAEVAKLYDKERAALAAGAHITNFLHIFATRNVREILRQQSLDGPAMPALSRPLLVTQGKPGAHQVIWSAAPQDAGKSPRP